MIDQNEFGINCIVISKNDMLFDLTLHVLYKYSKCKYFGTNMNISCKHLFIHTYNNQHAVSVTALTTSIYIQQT